jgi:predicted O-methyltransferase YrrM
VNVEKSPWAEYIAQLFGEEDDLLRSFREEAQRNGLPPIQVPFEVGRLLQLLVIQSGAMNVLEIGSLFGYSTTMLGRVLPPRGRLITLEAVSLHAETTRRNLERAGLGDRVDVRCGRALDLLAEMDGQSFDFVFIDADKETYPEYLEWALRLSHERSLIVADNVWRDGAVVTPEPGNAGNAAINRFNRLVANNSRLLSTFIPTREGQDALSISVVLPS